MPTKWGRIGSLGRKGAKFVEAYLDSGERVELPHDVLRYITETYSPETSLVFVERRGRLFHFVQWVGTPDEAVAALEQGILSAREVPAGVQIIGESLRRLSRPSSAAVAQEPDPVGRVTIAEAGGPVAKFLHDAALFSMPASADFAGLAHDPAVLAFVDGLARLGAIDWAHPLSVSTSVADGTLGVILTQSSRSSPRTWAFRALKVQLLQPTGSHLARSVSSSMWSPQASCPGSRSTLGWQRRGSKSVTSSSRAPIGSSSTE